MPRAPVAAEVGSGCPAPPATLGIALCPSFQGDTSPCIMKFASLALNAHTELSINLDSIELVTFTLTDPAGSPGTTPVCSAADVLFRAGAGKPVHYEGAVARALHGIVHRAA